MVSWRPKRLKGGYLCEISARRADVRTCLETAQNTVA
jgi:hypothetical protein